MPFSAPVIEALGLRVEGTFCGGCDALREALWAKERQKLAALDPEAPKTRAELWKQRATTWGFGRYLEFDAAFIAGRLIPWDKGLFMAGETGKGKTFLAVEIIRRQFMAGRSVFMADAIDFGFKVATPDADRREKALAACVEPDWLLVDDLCKGKVTDRVAEGLFHIANQRENHGRKTIWTTNATEGQLRDRRPGDMRDAFMERVARSCETLVFE